MKKIVYVLTHDPKDRIELLSSALAQALTALSFGYECDLFVMDRAVKLLQPAYIEGLKADTFDPIADLLRHYQEMGGKLFGCNPAIASHNIKTENCVGGISGFVNASKLIECSVEASAVFTY
ncbi:MAG TPA: DsrE family protein [Nitrospirota bacterium]